MSHMPRGLEITYPLAPVSKSEFDEQAASLRTKLLTVQHELRGADFPFLLIIGGADSLAGRVVNRLHQWMDARFIHTTAFLPPTDEESGRPFFWRFWRHMPPKGLSAISVQGWTAQTMVARITGEIDDAEFKHRLGHVRTLEKMLADDGAAILKIWLQPQAPRSAKERRKAARSNEINVWTAGGHGKRIMKHYEKNSALVAEALEQTSSESAPWYVLPADHSRSVELAVGDLVHDVLRSRLNADEEVDPKPLSELLHPSPDHLAGVDLSSELTNEKYEKRLDKWQKRFGELTRRAYEKRMSTIIVFEGWDAAGKGGAIRRLTGAMDAALYRVVPIKAPTRSELAYPYLNRFWIRLPRPGQVVVFDRSWYGRLLVERIEGFASEEEWRRAYAEINDFEEQLVEDRVILLKYWIHIDPDTQLARFKEREQIPFKNYKITQEDHRNRDKWPQYARAVNDMVELTGQGCARWHLVAGNDKRFARVEVVKRACKTIAAALGD